MKSASVITAGLLLLLFTTAVHTVVRPMQAHAKADTEHHHNAAPSIDCATLCTTAIVKRDDDIRHAEEEQDDELQPTPFIPAFGRAYYEGLYSFNYDKWPPPSKVPIYKLHSVLLS